MPSATTVLSTAASLAASVVLVRTIVNDLLPWQIQDYLFSTIRSLLNRNSSQFTIIIDEFDGFSINEIYEAVETYLSTKISPTTRSLKVTKPQKEKNIKITMEKGEEVFDTFQGIQLKWRLVSQEVERALLRHSYHDHNTTTFQSQTRYFELSFHKKHKEMVLGSYLQFVVSEAKTMKEKLKTVKLHTVQYENLYGNLADAWRSVNLDHPATFETLAMDTELKRTVMKDLERFVERREFYRRVGKAWKRGYLLYGPPGTGKSSLIAAMANFLNFNVYDLELTDIQSNSELRKVLLATANRSIIVIEDIDCTIDLKDREKQGEGSQTRDDYHQPKPQVTLSGLLNFVDGLWSSCGDERIIIFTTNHKDRLDLALLRPGRMDMHIHMSYLTASGFDVLASNYLGIENHKLFDEIRRLLAMVEVTPAEVAEELMKIDDPDVSLRGLIEFLRLKKREADEAKAKRENENKDESQNGQLIGEEGKNNETDGNENKDEEQIGQQIREKGENIEKMAKHGDI